MKRFIKELGMKQKHYVVHSDSQSAINLIVKVLVSILNLSILILGIIGYKTCLT